MPVLETVLGPRTCFCELCHGLSLSCFGCLDIKIKVSQKGSLRIDEHGLFEKIVEDGELNENMAPSLKLVNNIEQNPHLNSPYKLFNKCAHRKRFLQLMLVTLFLCLKLTNFY